MERDRGLSHVRLNSLFINFTEMYDHRTTLQGPPFLRVSERAPARDSS